MKKSLIALAALAAVSAASAQSSVTLSGTVDTSLEKLSLGSPLQLATGRNGISNITLSGNEDLGGGLKAGFFISTRFDSSYSDATTAASAAAAAATPQGGTGTNTSLGSNGTFLSLAGDFGKVLLGRPSSVLVNNTLTANAITNSVGGVIGFGGVGGLTAAQTLFSPNADAVFTANGLQYHSPNFNGFSVQLEYAPSEAQNVKGSTALGLKYENGPVAVTFTTQRAKAIATGADNSSKVNQLAAAYDFNVAKVFFTMTRDTGFYDSTTAASNTGATPNYNFSAEAYKAYLLGVSAPVGASGTVWAQYGSAKSDAFVNTSANKIYSLGYKYALSKRTSLYAQAGRSSVASVKNATSDSINGYGLGITHNF